MFIFIVFLGFSVILFAMGYYSYSHYINSRDLDKLKGCITVVVAGVLILSMNLIWIYPLADFDSVRYMAELRTDGDCTVILPFPNEEGLEDEIEVKRGHGEFRVVDSEKGRGLEVSFDEYVYIEGAYLVHYNNVDYSTELEDGSNFWFHLTGDNSSFQIYELRIIHQSPSDFHSKQIFVSNYKYHIVVGWNQVEWSIYRE